MRDRNPIDRMTDLADGMKATPATLSGRMHLASLCLSGFLFLLSGSCHLASAQTTASQGANYAAAGPNTNPTAGKAKIPNLVWFAPSSWYPVTEVNGQRVPGKPSAGGWKPGYDLQGDFDALFMPGAQWDPSDVGLIVFNGIDINSRFDPDVKALIDWTNAHPNVKVGILVTPVTVGPGAGCVSSGNLGFPQKGTPLTINKEGLYYSLKFPEVNYPFGEFKSIEQWHANGGRLDVLLFDTPLTAGIDRCDFSVAGTVSHMLPLIRKVQNLYPTVQFSSEQGPVTWTDHDWIYTYSLPFFQEFAKQVGVPMQYTNLDIHLDGDVRKPPTPVYTTVAAATRAFTAAGVKVGVNITAPSPRPGQTQEQWMADNKAYMLQAVNSGLPFDHIEYAPFGGFGRHEWVLNNMPETSPAAVTSLLPLSR